MKKSVLNKHQQIGMGSCVPMWEFVSNAPPHHSCCDGDILITMVDPKQELGAHSYANLGPFQERGLSGVSADAAGAGGSGRGAVRAGVDAHRRTGPGRGASRDAERRRRPLGKGLDSDRAQGWAGRDRTD